LSSYTVKHGYTDHRYTDNGYTVGAPYNHTPFFAPEVWL
jgi:hypothetical protein